MSKTRVNIMIESEAAKLLRVHAALRGCDMGELLARLAMEHLAPVSVGSTPGPGVRRAQATILEQAVTGQHTVEDVGAALQVPAGTHKTDAQIRARKPLDPFQGLRQSKVGDEELASLWKAVSARQEALQWTDKDLVREVFGGIAAANIVQWLSLIHISEPTRPY